MSTINQFELNDWFNYDIIPQLDIGITIRQQAK